MHRQKTIHPTADTTSNIHSSSVKGCQPGKSDINKVLLRRGLSFRGTREKSATFGIAEFHHEAVNGRGYPTGKKGDDIPLEARIVAVADVFDALTSERPYKDAWGNKEAINTIKQLSGQMLDQGCVDALLENIEKVEKIQQQFTEDAYG